MNTPASHSESVWADLVSVALPILAFGVLALVGVELGYVSPLSGPDVVVLVAAMLSITITNMFAFYAAKGAVLHRVGFQLCGLNLGTCFSLLALQLLSSADILPGLAASTLLNALDFLPGGIAVQRLAMISLLGFASVVTLGVTARIVRSIDHEQAKWPALLKLGSYAIGFGMLFINVWLIMGKQ